MLKQNQFAEKRVAAECWFYGITRQNAYKFQSFRVHGQRKLKGPTQ